MMSEKDPDDLLGVADGYEALIAGAVDLGVTQEVAQAIVARTCGWIGEAAEGDQRLTCVMEGDNDRPAPPPQHAPESAVRRLNAFLVKVPPRGDIEKQMRKDLEALIAAFIPLNEAAVRGELRPGFWGGFAARCQKALKDVGSKAKAEIAKVEADGYWAESTVAVERRRAFREVLEWLGQP